MLHKLKLFVLKKLPSGVRDSFYALNHYKLFGNDGKQNRILIMFIDGKVWHGGFCDRLKGIISLYHYSLATQLDFRIYYIFPFQLQKFLSPNSHNWMIDSIEISNKYQAVKYLNLIGEPTFSRLEHLNGNRQIHCHANRDMVSKINMHYGTNFTWGFLFNSLFKPTNVLETLIAFHKIALGNDYISAHFRFVNIFNDFKDDIEIKTSEASRESILNKSIDTIRHLSKQFPNRKIFIASDSEYFLKRISIVENVYVLSGKILHIDHSHQTDDDVYIKIFLDFFLLSESKHIFSFGTPQMYQSEFPLYAAKVNDVPFERRLIL